MGPIPLLKNMDDTPPRLNYWRLWVVDALLVGAGMLSALAAPYGTMDFPGRACLMALLPMIPAVVLVGGAGSTIFGLTKVMIERRSLSRPAAAALLVGPALGVFLVCLLLAAGHSPQRRLAYICHGNSPEHASRVRVTGYSAFLNEEWLAVFQVDPREFQTMINRGGFAPADGFKLRRALERSRVGKTRLFAEVPPQAPMCYQRVFDPGGDHERGIIYAAFDPASSTAVVFREYHD